MYWVAVLWHLTRLVPNIQLKSRPQSGSLGTNLRKESIKPTASHRAPTQVCLCWSEGVVSPSRLFKSTPARGVCFQVVFQDYVLTDFCWVLGSFSVQFVTVLSFFLHDAFFYNRFRDRFCIIFDMCVIPFPFAHATCRTLENYCFFNEFTCFFLHVIKTWISMIFIIFTLQVLALNFGEFWHRN